MAKIITVDFQTKEVLSSREETAEIKEERLDPVLEKVKSQMSPEDFEVYKRVVDHWQEANFLYQIELLNKTDE